MALAVPKRSGPDSRSRLKAGAYPFSAMVWATSVRSCGSMFSRYTPGQDVLLLSPWPSMLARVTDVPSGHLALVFEPTVTVDEPCGLTPWYPSFQARSCTSEL